MTNLAIVGVGYTEAFQVLRDANQYAALHHTRLAEGLAGSAGMAGDSSFASEWAASYDDAAGLAVAAFEDVVTALGATARLCAGSLDNHARAELASAALDPGEWPSLLVDHPYEVSAFVPPSSLGGDPSSLPGWANAILDHVEGFVWPDADLDALHAVAAVWRGLADHLDSAAELVARAASHLWDERSPEVPLAVDALGRLRSAIGDLAAEAAWLARSCSEYAEAVQAQRDAILDLVHDLLRDAVIIQAAGFLVGLVTAGTANAAAGGLNVAKIAAEGPRFLAMLDHLRDLAYTASLGLNAGATTITGIQTRLGPFVRARLALRSEAGRVSLARAYARDWLRTHEVRGSHTIAKHVGKSNAWLRRRLARDPRIRHASTFESLAAAEAAARGVMRRNRTVIREWLAGGGSELAVTGPASSEMGRVMSRSGAILEPTEVYMRIRRDPAMPMGFRIFTTYLLP